MHYNAPCDGKESLRSLKPKFLPDPIVRLSSLLLYGNSNLLTSSHNLFCVEYLTDLEDILCRIWTIFF